MPRRFSCGFFALIFRRLMEEKKLLQNYRAATVTFTVQKSSSLFLVKIVHFYCKGKKSFVARHLCRIIDHLKAFFRTNFQQIEQIFVKELRWEKNRFPCFWKHETIKHFHPLYSQMQIVHGVKMAANSKDLAPLLSSSQ